jgi:hypothetical protein
MIEYHFILAEGGTFTFQVDPDQPPQPSARHAEWARLGFHQCGLCPLRESTHPCCPAAVAVEAIAQRFASLVSYQAARVVIRTADREYARDCDVQTGLRSLLGLVMANSECPVLAHFRGLARFHLPFANLEETVFRTVSAYLLKQHFAHREGGVTDWDLTHLTRFYEQLQEVNRAFHHRLLNASTQDANLNALVSLNYMAMGVTFSLEDQLLELRRLFPPPTA